MELIERKLEISELPTKLGKFKVLGETFFVQAIGVRLKRHRFYPDDLFLDFDKKYFVAKDGKGNIVNCKIVGE